MNNLDAFLAELKNPEVNSQFMNAISDAQSPDQIIEKAIAFADERGYIITHEEATVYLEKASSAVAGGKGSVAGVTNVFEAAEVFVVAVVVCCA